MNCKNTAQQLFNISEDIYKSFYHIVFLEVCRAYQIIPDGLFISKKPCIGKPSDEFLDSWERELENTEINLREVLIKEYVVELAEVVLKNNIFTFKEKTLKQKRGTAIGTKFAPPYSVLFMAELEEEILSEIELKPYL